MLPPFASLGLGLIFLFCLKANITALRKLGARAQSYISSAPKGVAQRSRI